VELRVIIRPLTVNILVTGSNGQLGHEIRQLVKEHKNFNCLFTDIEELDITNDELLHDYFSLHRFDCIINCAAYTAVDKAEEERAQAMLVNATAPGYLAQCARDMEALMVHISTDYIFDGKKNRPYEETDTPGPLSYYGLTKLRGEEQILSQAGRGLLFRTSWLYSSFGKNFVKTIITHGLRGETLHVVDDQTGTPTYACDLAAVILQCITKYVKQNTSIYHYSNEGSASWYDFALAVLKIAGISCKIVPVKTSSYPSKAKRPSYSVLNKNKIRNDFGITIPYWRDSLEECVKEIVRNEIDKG
jgi:dTDP-4-dehydrorhamnose reductase